MDSKRRELADKNAIHESKSLNGELCSFENNVVEKMDSLGDGNTCRGRVLDAEKIDTFINIFENKLIKMVKSRLFLHR